METQTIIISILFWVFFTFEMTYTLSYSASACERLVVVAAYVLYNVATASLAVAHYTVPGPVAAAYILFAWRAQTILFVAFLVSFFIARLAREYVPVWALAGLAVLQTLLTAALLAGVRVPALVPVGYALATLVPLAAASYVSVLAALRVRTADGSPGGNPAGNPAEVNNNGAGVVVRRRRRVRLCLWAVVSTSAALGLVFCAVYSVARSARGAAPVDLYLAASLASACVWLARPAMFLTLRCGILLLGGSSATNASSSSFESEDSADLRARARAEANGQVFHHGDPLA